MGGTCCTSKNQEGEINENVTGKFIIEKEETLEDLDWRFKIDHTYYVPKNPPILQNNKCLGEDMLKFLNSFNTDCPFNQFVLIKENLEFPISSMGIIKSCYNLEIDSNPNTKANKIINNSRIKEKIGTGIILNPFVILTVIQNAFELIEKKSNINVSFKMIRFEECKFFAMFNGLQGFEYEIEDVLLSSSFEEKKIKSKNDFYGFCLLILKSPIGLETGYVGLPKFLKQENKYNFSKQQSIRQNRRENQSVELNGHTFYRVDKKIFLFESKIFAKKILNSEINKTFLSLSGINFDMLPGAPFFYPKSEKKILMGLFSHTQKIDQNIKINNNNNLNSNSQSGINTQTNHNNENEDSTGGNNFIYENQEKNIGLLIEEHLDDLIFTFEKYLENKKIKKKTEIELTDKNINNQELDRIIEYSGINYQNVSKFAIKDLIFSENTVSYLEKAFCGFKNLKYLILENNQIQQNLDLDFRDLKTITELNLSYNNLSKNTVISICHNLKLLRKLRLINCNLTDVCIDYISNNLIFVETLGLNYNNFSDESVILLFDSMKSLKELYLKGNGLTDNCLENLEKSLPFIELISLSENKISNVGLKKIVDSRKKGMIYLTKLYLSSNTFDDSGAILLKEINGLLEELDISNNNLNSDLLNEINKIIF